MPAPHYAPCSTALTDVLVLRPQPGADRTYAGAVAMGLDARVAPIFHVVPLPWQTPPASEYSAVVLTSAHAARHAGPALGAYLALPCYTVGDSSAEAARAAGFDHVRAGPGDVVALAAMMREEGVGRALHLCGRDHLALDLDGVDRRVVYAAEALPFLLPDALQALRDGAIALLHSPRAARHFAALVDGAGIDRDQLSIAAISEAAASAAGPGWARVAIAAVPRDQPLLELAAKLCKEGGSREQR